MKPSPLPPLRRNLSLPFCGLAPDLPRYVTPLGMMPLPFGRAIGGPTQSQNDAWLMLSTSQGPAYMPVWFWSVADGVPTAFAGELMSTFFRDQMPGRLFVPVSHVLSRAPR